MAIFAGFALLAAANAVAIAAAVPLPSGGVWLRVAHHLFDAAETLGLGAIIALGAFAFMRIARLPTWAMGCLLVAITMAVVYRTIGEALTRFASLIFGGRFESALLGSFLGLLGVGFPLVLHVAARLSRGPRLRFIPVFVAVTAIAIDQSCLRDDYMGMHGVIAWGAAMVS